MNYINFNMSQICAPHFKEMWVKMGHIMMKYWMCATSEGLCTGSDFSYTVPNFRPNLSRAWPWSRRVVPRTQAGIRKLTYKTLIDMRILRRSMITWYKPSAASCRTIKVRITCLQNHTAIQDRNETVLYLYCCVLIIFPRGILDDVLYLTELSIEPHICAILTSIVDTLVFTA